MRPLALLSSGMVTPVGLTAPATCAAVRAAIAGSVETAFLDGGGEPLLGCPVPLEGDETGLDRAARLASMAVAEALAEAGLAAGPDVPLLLGLPEEDRPGRPSWYGRPLFEAVERTLGVRFSDDSGVVARGRTSVAHAVRRAETLVYEGRARAVVIAAADNLLVGESLRSFERRRRLLTSLHSDGFIAGEAAAAVVVSAPAAGAILRVLGTALGSEEAAVESDKPLRGDGLARAFREALRDANATFDDVDYRLMDGSGEQYRMKETALALARAVRKVKPEFDLWHPADSIGEVGAAIGPVLLGVALAAARKGYAPGPGVLCHLGADDGERAVIVLRTEGGR